MLELLAIGVIAVCQVPTGCALLNLGYVLYHMT